MEERFSRYAVPILLVASAFVLVLPIVLMGTPGGDDFNLHMTSWLDVSSQSALYPRWTNGANFGFGDARFILYPPASWFLGGTLCRILPLALAPGTYLFLCGLIASFGMYRLAGEFMPRRESMVAGAAFTLCPYTFYNIYHRSAYSEVLAMALLPWSLALLFRLRSSRGPRQVVLFSFSLGLIWLTHIPSAILMSTALGCVALAWFSLDRDYGFLLRAAAGFLIAVGLTSFYWLRVVDERSWVHLGSLKPISLETFDLAHRVFYAIAGVQILAAIGLVVYACRRPSASSVFRRMIVVLAVLSMIMLSPAGLPLYRHTFFSYVSLPFHWLSILALLYAFAAAYVASSWPRLVGAVAALGVAAMLVSPALVGHHGGGAGTLQDTRNAIADHQGYADLVVDWDPRGFDYDHSIRGLPSASFVPAADGIATKSCGAEDLQVKSWTPLQEIVETDCPVSSVLRFRLAYYPLWRITANGEAVGSSQGDHGVLQASLPAGRNHVEVLLQEPRFHTLGEAGSALTFALCIVLALIPATQNLPKALSPGDAL